MKSKPLFAAVLSAAERSPYFGDIPAMVPLDGVPAITHCIAAFREAGVETIVVVAGSQKEKIKVLVPETDGIVIRNFRSAHEMSPAELIDLAGVPCGCCAAFAHPVDVPLISPTTITLLSEAYLEHQSNRRWFIPAFDGKEGYPILIPRGRGENGNGSEVCRALSDAAKVIVPVYDEGILESLIAPDGRDALNVRFGRRHIPGETAIKAMLHAAGTPPDVLLHQQRVTETALKIAQLAAPYVHVNITLLKAAAELHDILKTCPGHAERGGRLLRKYGFSEVAEVVREHMDLSRSPSIEAEILFLADKYVSGIRVESLGDREMRMREKFAHDRPALQAAIRRMRAAREVEKRLEKIANVSPLLKYLQNEQF